MEYDDFDKRPQLRFFTMRKMIAISALTSLLYLGHKGINDLEKELAISENATETTLSPIDSKNKKTEMSNNTSANIVKEKSICNFRFRYGLFSQVSVVKVAYGQVTLNHGEKDSITLDKGIHNLRSIPLGASAYLKPNNPDWDNWALGATLEQGSSATLYPKLKIVDNQPVGAGNPVTYICA